MKKENPPVFILKRFEKEISSLKNKESIETEITNKLDKVMTLREYFEVNPEKYFNLTKELTISGTWKEIAVSFSFTLSDIKQIQTNANKPTGEEFLDILFNKNITMKRFMEILQEKNYSAFSIIESNL